MSESRPTHLPVRRSQFVQEFDPLEDEIGIELQNQIISFIKDNTDESGSDLQPSNLYSRETESKMVDETERRSRFKMFTDTVVTETTNSEGSGSESGSDVEAKSESEAPDIISEHVIASVDGAEAVEESDNSTKTPDQDPPDQEPPEKNAGDSKTSRSPSRSKILDLVEAYVNHLNVTGISKTGYRYIFLRKDVTYIRYSGDFFNRHEDYLSLTTNCVEEYTGLMCVGASEDLLGGETAFSVGPGFTLGRKGKQNTAVTQSHTGKTDGPGERRPKGEVLSAATTTPRCAVFFRKDIPHEGTKVLKGTKEVIMFDLFAVQTAIAPSIRMNLNHHDHKTVAAAAARNTDTDSLSQGDSLSQSLSLLTYPAIVAIGINIPETVSLRDLLIGNSNKSQNQVQKEDPHDYSSNYIVVPCSGVLNTSLRLRDLIEGYEPERIRLAAEKLNDNSSDLSHSGPGTTRHTTVTKTSESNINNASSSTVTRPSLRASLMEGFNNGINIINQVVTAVTGGGVTGGGAGLETDYFGFYSGNSEEVGTANVWETREKDFDVFIDKTKSTAQLIFVNIHGGKGNYLPVYSRNVSKSSKSVFKEKQAKIMGLLRKLERVFHRSYLSFEDYDKKDFKGVLKHLGIPHFNVLV